MFAIMNTTTGEVYTLYESVFDALENYDNTGHPDTMLKNLDVVRDDETERNLYLSNPVFVESMRVQLAKLGYMIG